jgi:methylglutaconyl-CoA hydratase
MTAQATTLVFKPLAYETPDVVAVLTLSRPEAANAFNASVISELTTQFARVAGRSDVRCLVVRGSGKHFSAGADLQWMRSAANLSYADNLADAGRLSAMFESLAHLKVPTLALVNGSAFGGAVGLIAACDIAVAASDAKFALSEVKLGILPAVILPYLARRLKPSSLRRFALTGRPFSASEALDCGLIARVVPSDDLEYAGREELAAILAGSPFAQAEFKNLHSQLAQTNFAQGKETAESIARLRTSQSGQDGLAAFFDKKPAPWMRDLAAGWQLFDTDQP